MSVSPPPATRQEPPRAGPKRWSLRPPSRWEWLVIGGIVAVLLGLIIPQRRSARSPAARRPTCGSGSLRQIGTALRIYAEDAAHKEARP